MFGFVILFYTNAKLAKLYTFPDAMMDYSNLVCIDLDQFF